jgi:hypothetical protein
MKIPFRIATAAVMFTTGWGALQATGLAAPARDVFVTNRVSRVITNVVEVRMPLNVFRDEYRTNWVAQSFTNVVDVYKTNWVQRTVTNVVTSYQTNLNVFSITNWQTVVVLKTNWVTQTVTNAVHIQIATPDASPKAALEPAPRAQIIGQEQGYQIELIRTDKPVEHGHAEVQLAIRSLSDPSATPEVQEWQFIRPDGTVLLFGRRARFTTELPFGTYKVVAQVRRASKAPLAVNGAVQILDHGKVQLASTTVR